MKSKLVNKNTFNLKSTITDDWGGSHRIELDLEALAATKDWKIGIDIPEGYTIDQAYGALITQENGKSYITGANVPNKVWNKDLSKGDQTKVILIVSEGDKSNLNPIEPKFFFANPANKPIPNVTKPTESNPTFDIDGQITEDWQGGYKLELGLTPEANAENWKLDFKLPYKISAAYGVDLVNKGNGSYTISGQNDQASLNKGQSIKPIFIIQDKGQKALVPEFIQPQPISVPKIDQPKTVAPKPKDETPSQPITPNPTPKKALAKLGVDPSITEDWQGGYKLELGLTAETKSDNWKLDFKLPYKISAAYGVDLVNNEDGTYTISGQNDQVSLNKRQSIKPIFIIQDNGQKALVPEFIQPQPISVPKIDQPKTAAPKPKDETPSEPIAPNPTPKKAAAKLGVDPSIAEDWQGGYKLELGLTAETKSDNWKLDFNLPYEISAAYGVDMVDNGNGSYTISGQNNQVNLNKGQSIKPIFIVQDNGQKALIPEFDGKNIDLIDKPKVKPTTPTKNNNNHNPDPVNIPDGSGKSVGQRGKFAYGEALQKNFLFLEANRSGDLGPENRLEWRQDSTMKDGSTVGRDLEGGYFDAGDHVKFGQPMAASVNMLAWGGVEYKQAYAQAGQLDELLEAVKWGTDYFLKAHETSGGKTSKFWVQVGEGGSANDHGYWGAPETVEANTTRRAFAIDPSRPGSDVAASTSSAFAAASMLFRGVDNAYADKLLKNARQLYEFAETYQGKYSDSVAQANPYYTSWSGYGDELASGAAWLYKATGEQSYLNKAENHFKTRIGGLGDWSWAADDHSYGAGVILAQESDDPYFKGQVEGWLDRWINGGGNIKYSSGGFAHRSAWGSIPIVSSAAYLAQLYNDTVREDSRYSDFANNQVDYILGDNPRNYSYMVGFGENYPQRPHHRGSHPSGGDPTVKQENILYGAVVGGPKSADDYSHNDRRDDWVTNEVGTSYNAPFASALIQQYDNLGGDPLSEAQLDQLIGVDANGVGF